MQNCNLVTIDWLLTLYNYINRSFLITSRAIHWGQTLMSMFQFPQATWPLNIFAGDNIRCHLVSWLPWIKMLCQLLQSINAKPHSKLAWFFIGRSPAQPRSELQPGLSFFSMKDKSDRTSLDFSVDHFGMSNCCHLLQSDSWFPQEINAQDMHFALSVFLLSTQDISGAIHLHAAQVHHPSFQVYLQQTASLQQPCGHDKPRLPLHTLWLPDKSGANSSWLAAD